MTVLRSYGAGLAILAFAACERRRPVPTNAPTDDALPVSFPHPGYLDDCVPKIALRPGEQRRVGFECGGEGLLGEWQGWWGESNDDLTGERIKLTNPDVMLCGLCGCIFSLAFATPTVYGQLVSLPGRDCGKFRQYCMRILRLRKPESPDPWRVRLDSACEVGGDVSEPS